MHRLEQAVATLVTDVIAANHFGELAPGLDCDLFDECGFTSLGLVSLIVALENQVGISLQDEHFCRSHFRSVRSICSLLRAHYAQALAPAGWQDVADGVSG